MFNLIFGVQGHTYTWQGQISKKICFGGYLFITHIVEGLKAESTTFVNSTTMKISY